MERDPVALLYGMRITTALLLQLLTREDDYDITFYCQRLDGTRLSYRQAMEMAVAQASKWVLEADTVAHEEECRRYDLAMQEGRPYKYEPPQVEDTPSECMFIFVSIPSIGWDGKSGN